MSKNVSAPLLRTARLLDLVPYLNTHQGIALKDLAAHFDITPAQMSADLTTLWMCGLPGYTPLELMDLEFESGYVTIRNATTLSDKFASSSSHTPTLETAKKGILTTMIPRRAKPRSWSGKA